MSSVLIIEDNEAQRVALEEYVQQLLGKDGQVFAAPEGEIAFSVLADRKVDLILSDLMLPDMNGIDIIKRVRQDYIDLPIVIMTGEPSYETAIEAIREGANDYLLKPIDLTVLKKKVESLLENTRLRQENRELRERLSETFQASRVIGHSTQLQAVLEKCRQIAPTDVTILIEGESGTGKEIIANLLHENSPRNRHPFIRVNCGAITRTLLESELFGVVKGAYTGADKSRAGYFESAHGGTIFLDEIGELDLDSQVRLLRVLEEREVMRIGSSKAIHVDVRILAATNRDLLTQVEEGRFREDLYYRLAVIKLGLPPLRERVADLPLLFNHFVMEFNERYAKSVTTLSPELKQFFDAYDWPGNIRQFRNVLEGMVVLASEDILDKNDLPPELAGSNRRLSDKRLNESIIAGMSLEDYEKAIIAKNLALQGGNRERTADILGISARTLYRKLKDFNIEG